jgi:hypothetical protein
MIVESFEAATADRFVFQINNYGMFDLVDFIVPIVLSLDVAIPKIQVFIK